jgi:hypothetical protein
MSIITLLGTTIGLGFTSGLNLYATVLITGLLIRLGWLQLPGSLEGLHVLASPVVLFVAGILYAVEFLADKIPIVDHVWDAFHTFIRPLGACLLAWRAVAGAAIPEPATLAVILLAGGAALATHSTKAGGRVAIAATGGHLAGLGVGASLVEDAGAFALAPLAVGHPITMFVIVVVAFVVMGVLAVRILRPVGILPETVHWAVRHGFAGKGEGAVPLPEYVEDSLKDAGVVSGRYLALPAYVGRLYGMPRWKSGFLALTADKAVFVGSGRWRHPVVPLARAEWAASASGSRWRTEIALRRQADRAVFVCYPLTEETHVKLGSLIAESDPALTPTTGR